MRCWRLERGANDLHMVQLMPLPPHQLLLQQNPEWFILLVPAYPGCPGKKAVKRLCVCVCVYASTTVHMAIKCTFSLIQLSMPVSFLTILLIYTTNTHKYNYIVHFTLHMWFTTLAIHDISIIMLNIFRTVYIVN